MTFLEAALEILKREGRPLHYKELTDRAMTKKLLTFVGRTPEVTMQTQLTAAIKKAPGNPFVRVKPGVFGLLRYPERPADEPEPEPEAPAVEEAGEPVRTDGGARNGGEATEGERGRRRRRRGGRGRGRGEGDRPRAGSGASVEPPVGAADRDEPVEMDEPGGGLSAAARAAALASTGVLDAGGDDDEPGGAGDGGSGLPGRTAGADDDDSDEEAEGDAAGGEIIAAGGGVSVGVSGAAIGAGELGHGRRRRRRRRRRGLGENDMSANYGGPPDDGAPGGATEGQVPGEGGEAIAAGGEPGGSPPPDAPGEGGEAPREGLPPPTETAPGEGQAEAGRRIMAPIDAAIEVLKGQAPGRGIHVRQIADMAVRRKLVHGEPNEAWRVIRAALAAEPKERLRAGQRPRVRAAGSGLYALARRPADMDLERAEHVFGEARRALRERTVAALERRLTELPPPAFEALARVLLQREGFGPCTFVKRVDGTIYMEALRGRGSRPSKTLIALRSGGGPAGRRAIGELRAGVRARNQDEGLLLCASRLAEDGIAEWKQSGAPIEIADGPALAETCIRHGVGVATATVQVDFVDADFFAELAEG